MAGPADGGRRGRKRLAVGTGQREARVALAEWIVHGDPGVDLAEMSLSRFRGLTWDAEEIRRGARRVYETYYDLPAPA